jgi:CubicO group peptidase (beta-lactamase class C family)
MGVESEIDRLMSAYQGRVPGASVLVLKDGKPLVRQRLWHGQPRTR